jgi:tubulin polyglutamylase TTLL6/13
MCYELLGFDIILDRSLKPWLLEVNHLPSFNHDTFTDCQVKTDLIRDLFAILALSVEHRKRVHRDLRAEQKQAMLSGGFFKRLTVREHLERVRFDPGEVAKKDPGNGFRLIYPKGEGNSAADDDGWKYEKFLRKAHEIWQVTTGTVRASQV